jgi:hypothetical protein
MFVAREGFNAMKTALKPGKSAGYSQGADTTGVAIEQ